MRLRRFKALFAVPALAVGMLAPTIATPAHAAPSATVCAVAGTVDVNPGVGGIPPSGDNTGTYVFHQVVLVCVGGNIGAGAATSNGAFGTSNCGGTDIPLVGDFCGSYNSSGFLVGPGCTGTVGGPEGAVGNAGTGRWSLTFGAFLAGDITCTQLNARGVLALVAEPVPTSLGSTVTGSTCAAPPPQAPLPPPQVWFCQIVIEGVAVLVGT